MNISSNSLFHFTDRIEVLVDILNDKFRGSYCREVLHYKEEAIPIYIPKISFCDIPLKTLSNYSIYGKFGIGLRKEWGIKNRLNPVLYLEKNSLLAESL
ncbi:MAG TPA: abortive infection system antitoxin AbiGi family protein, partial [Ginsengibacter sp.]